MENKCIKCFSSTIIGGYFYGFCIKCSKMLLDQERSTLAKERAANSSLVVGAAS